MRMRAALMGWLAATPGFVGCGPAAESAAPAQAAPPAMLASLGGIGAIVDPLMAAGMK